MLIETIFLKVEKKKNWGNTVRTIKYDFLSHGIILKDSHLGNMDTHTHSLYLAQSCCDHMKNYAHIKY